MSNQDKWYLDHLNIPWEEFYKNEPLTNITNPEQQSLVLGGEVCMWGETVDGSNIEQTIWPRAAAAAGIYCISCQLTTKLLRRCNIFILSYPVFLFSILCSCMMVIEKDCAVTQTII